MGRTFTLFTYKLRFFFGPALRGRFGPLAYLALILIFLPSGFAFGITLGTTVRDANPTAAIGVLAAPLAGLLSFGLLYALGAGVTAHASEFDFFLTADVRPREYLVADLLFQLVSLLGAGGLSAGVAAVGMAVTVGQPAVAALPLFGLLIVYAFFVLMTSQVLVILRVRFPKRPVRLVTTALLILSLVPSASLADPGFPIRFADLPLPSTAFAALGLAVLRGTTWPILDVLLALAYAGGIAAAWYALSNTYIVHGLRPTMSAGFGQVDMGSRMEIQRHMTARLGVVTTRVRFRPERGGATSLMTRLHLVRIWRDGSILFVALFAVIGILSSGVGRGGANPIGVVAVSQLLTFILGILAMNWAFYERENMWIVLTSAQGPGAYFRGLMLSFALIGLGVTGVFLALLAATHSLRLPIESLALSIASPIGGGFVAAALLTRVKLKPSALSFAALGIFFLVSLGGILGGLAAQAVVLAVRAIGVFAEAAQATVLLGFLVVFAAFGLWTVTRLAATFRL
ncbi:MAG TPA: hypothetical protein VNP71_04065 [Thermoplasmata archaeon]|nr:hypothetical protein [Thermoplasmata archaeon]